jgi:starvation-inducible DNA-binding protein
MHQRGKELQKYGTLRAIPIGLPEKARLENIEAMNQILADTMTLRDLYQKHHWQVAGPTFYQLHLLFEKHYNEQNELVDQLAERIQTLGGISIAMAPDVAETATIPRPPRGAEPPPVQISRLLEAHEIIIKQVRAAAKQASENGDDGTNDLLVSDVLRTNELQVWFVSEHIVDTDLVHAE